MKGVSGKQFCRLIVALLGVSTIFLLVWWVSSIEPEDTLWLRKGLAAEYNENGALVQLIVVGHRDTFDPAVLTDIAEDDKKSLYLLFLDETNFDDSHVHLLCGLAELRVLSLSKTKISDAGIRELSGCLSALETIHLYETNLTNQGVTALKALPNLKHVGLGDTRVTRDGIQELQVALPNVTIRLDHPILDL